jgi:hypothetical protein
METLLSWLIRLTAIGTLLPAFFMLWYLAGSDDQPRNLVAPVLGLAVMVFAVWSVVASFRSLPEEPARFLLIAVLPLVLTLLAWPFSGSKATGRQTLAEYVPATGWLAGPPLLTLVYLAVG